MSETKTNLEEQLKGLLKAAAAEGNVPVTKSLGSILLKNYKTPGIRAFVAAQNNAAIVSPSEAAKAPISSENSSTGSKRWFPSTAAFNDRPSLEKKSAVGKSDSFMNRFRPDKKKKLHEMVEEFSKGDIEDEVLSAADVAYDPEEVPEEVAAVVSEQVKKAYPVPANKLVKEEEVSGGAFPVITLEDLQGLGIEEIFGLFGNDLEEVKKWCNKNLGTKFGKHGKKSVVSFLEDKLSIAEEEE